MRVVVFNDSSTVRTLLRGVLAATGEFEVVAEAEDGRDAVSVCRRAGAQLVLMDVVMPHVDGLAASAAIASELAVPVVIVSSVIDIGNPDELFGAMQAGAVFVMSPPVGGQGSRSAREFIQVLRNIVVVDEHDEAAVAWQHPEEQSQAPATCAVLGIAASAGGPGATAELIRAAGAQLPPTLLVQHLASGFTESYARWLSDVTSVPVRVARGGDIPQSGTVLLAPPGRHLAMARGRVTTPVEPQQAMFRPSADVLFESFVSCGSDALAIVLSGMGEDGARGALSMRNAGGRLWVQDSSSSAVFGMPRAALSRAGADFVGPPHAMGLQLHRTEST